MATKIKMLKLLQEMHAFSELGRRNFSTKTPPLYLLQLRSHLANARPRRRLAIRVDLRDSAGLPDPVKITFLKPASPA
jgi:hypothetical protein